MKKYLLLQYILLLSVHTMQAEIWPKECNHKISGQIIDNETKEPIPYATINLENEEKGIIADNEGYFVLNNLCAGKFSIVCSSMGYEPYQVDVQVEEDTSLKILMKPQLMTLDEIVVSSNYVQQREKEESLSVEVVNNNFLKQNQGGSLMNSLDKLGGVSTIDIGSGQSKPVIRGLGFNRVVVVENGVKHEGQQWGADHGLEIDQYAVDNVEVIKGPASLKYGSDAIGGVIDVKQNKLPQKNTLSGSVDLTGKTNNNLIGTSRALAGRKEAFFATLRATWLDYGDYKVPIDSVDIYSYRAPLYKHRLRNTAGHEHNVHSSFGYVKPSFQSRFYVSNVKSKSGFFANAHGLEPRNIDEEFHDRSDRDIHHPYQQVNHFKVINKSQWEWNGYRLKSELGYQRNFRQEWSQYVSHGYMPPVYNGENGFDPQLEREFDKRVYSVNLELAYNQSDKLSFTTGFNGSYQDNNIHGRGFIIPAFRQLNLGGYILAKQVLNKKSTLQAGIRYDYGHIGIDRYNDWFTSPVISNSDTTYQHLLRAEELNRDFSNISWSVGYNHNTEHWSLKANIGKSFRMPIAKELGANGVNYHRFSYEVGDPSLSPELSYQFDAGVEYSTKKLAIGITPFVNYFSNYIYLNPTAEHDRLYGNGNQVFYYSESKVLRYGGEVHGHYEILKSLKLGLIAEYVYAEQLSGEKKGYTLPFSPPASAIFSLKYEKSKWRSLEDSYISLDYKITSAQNRIVPPENTTAGYQTVNLGVGSGLKLKNQTISFNMQVQNIFNTKYFNHTSYYRLINVPGAGRNFILNISIPFSIHI